MHVAVLAPHNAHQHTLIDCQYIYLGPKVFFLLSSFFLVIYNRRQKSCFFFFFFLVWATFLEHRGGLVFRHTQMHIDSSSPQANWIATKCMWKSVTNCVSKTFLFWKVDFSSDSSDFSSDYFSDQAGMVAWDHLGWQYFDWTVLQLIAWAHLKL